MDSHKGFKSDGYKVPDGEKGVKHHNATSADEHKMSHNFMTHSEDMRPVHPGESGKRAHVTQGMGGKDEPAPEGLYQGGEVRKAPTWQEHPKVPKVPNR